MPRPIALDDFRKLRLVSDPQIAPDGSRVACVVKRIDPIKNRYIGEVWVVPYPVHPIELTDNSDASDAPALNDLPMNGARRFTSADSSANHPRWSPDGRTLAFLSNRHKPLSQIYLIPADGGEARPLTKLESEGSIDSFRWSPDGRWIAFTFRATPEANRKAAIEARKEAELSSPVRHHTRLFYRLDGTGYFDDSFPQLWVADATTGEAHQLTDGPYACSNPTWSPDSNTLAFLSDRREERDIAPAHDAIYTIPVSSFSPCPTPSLVPSPPGSKEALCWSPDGTLFAYLGNPDPLDTWGTNNDRIFLLPISGGDTAQDLTGHTDWAVGYLCLSDSHELGGGDMVQWSADGRSIYFPASVRGDTRLCRVEINSKDINT